MRINQLRKQIRGGSYIVTSADEQSSVLRFGNQPEVAEETELVELPRCCGISGLRGWTAEAMRHGRVRRTKSRQVGTIDGVDVSRISHRKSGVPGAIPGVVRIGGERSIAAEQLSPRQIACDHRKGAPLPALAPCEIG